MIRRLYIDGFKSLRDTELNPTSINVLVGPNASGKSTVLQTLLLLRQSADSIDGSVKTLHLSGELYEAGTPLDAIHPAARHTIRIEVIDDSGAFNYWGDFYYNRDEDRGSGTRVLQGNSHGSVPLQLFLRDDHFAYLTAERIGPRVAYRLPLGEDELSGRVGKFGQFTTAILARAFNIEEKVEDWEEQKAQRFAKALLNLDGGALIDELKASQGSLIRLSNVMLNWVIPGANFSAVEHADTDSAMLQFTRDPHGTKARVRATHVGFGLAYSLPVIVSSLSLRVGGLLLVENPEAHLHPFSQSRMGAFLALIASTGRQIFVETHSDHLVNGIRLAVRYGLIPPEKVQFQFFHSSLTEEQSKITKIEIDESGRLSEWPPGFFDQIERDLSQL